MFASEIYGPGRIRLIDVPEPDPMDGPGQILFQPEMGCLCGSDVPFFLREPLYDPQPGHSLHEVVGRIIESNGTRHREGELAMSKIPGHTGVRERIWMKEDEANPLPKTLKIEEGVLSQPLGTVIHAARKLPNLVVRGNRDRASPVGSVAVTYEEGLYRVLVPIVTGIVFRIDKVKPAPRKNSSVPEGSNTLGLEHYVFLIINYFRRSPGA